MTPAPERVAYVLTHYPKLAQTFVTEEIRAMRALGVEIVPFALNRPAPADLATPTARDDAAGTIYVKHLGVPRVGRALARAVSNRPAALLRLWWQTMRATGPDLRRAVTRTLQIVEGVLVWDECRRRGISTLHAHFAGAPALVAMTAAELGRSGGATWRWSMTVHGPHDFADESGVLFGPKLASADEVVAISSFTRAQLLRLSRPEDWSKIHVVRCGVDLERLEFVRRPAAGRPARLLMVGRLAPEKCHIVMFEAVARLVRRGHEVRLDVVGDGELRGVLQTWLDTNELGERIRLIGELPPDGVRAALAGSDVFCLASAAEGLPVSIMEAMAVGTPVVATRINGIPELIDDGVTGYLAPAGDANALADAVERALASMDDRLVERARCAVEAAHDLRRTSRELRALLVGVA